MSEEGCTWRLSALGTSLLWLQEKFLFGTSCGVAAQEQSNGRLGEVRVGFRKPGKRFGAGGLTAPEGPFGSTKD